MKAINKKRKSLSVMILMAVIAMILPLTGCDDSEMFFTRDEIQGDIITGRQIPIDNHQSANCPGALRVNVGNSKGAATATTSNPEVAEVEIYQYGDRYPQLTIRLKTPGQTQIIVRDSKGNAATLYLTVGANDSSDIADSTNGQKGGTDANE